MEEIQNLTFKDLLSKNINFFKQKHKDDFDFYPLTFSDIDELIKNKQNLNNNQYWIVKPARGRQGEGIKIIQNIEKFIREYQQQKVIIQKYISNPLLINDLKFDIRLYVLLTSLDPLLIYVFKEGLVRFATKKYEQNCKSLKDCYMHLTNYSINKHSPDFIKNTHQDFNYLGNKQSYKSLLKLFKFNKIDTQILKTKINHLIVKTILTAESKLFQHNFQYFQLNNSFQLLGFDILIDNQINPWLIEVNLCPSLSIDSPLDQKIKSHLLANTLNLVGIIKNQYKTSSQSNNNINQSHNLKFMLKQLNKQQFTLFNHFVLQNNLDHSICDMLINFENQIKRKGQYKLIYPDKKQDYQKFFQNNRNKNEILQKWMKFKNENIKKSE